MTDKVTCYGFTYGPATIERLCHIPGRGRTLEVRTDHARVQLYISEAGRKIEMHRMDKPQNRITIQ